MNAESIPESAVRITSHEILALLSFNPGPGADLSRSVLGLADLPHDSDLVRAGLTTLHIREMAEAEGDSINLLGGALALSALVSTATQWFVVTRFGASSSLPVCVVNSPHGKAVIFGRPLSQYVCVPLRSDIDLLVFLEEIVNGAVGEAHDMDGGLVVVRHHGLGQDVVIANVKVNADGTRQLAAPPVQEDGQLTVSAIDGVHSPGEVIRGVFSNAT